MHIFSTNFRVIVPFDRENFDNFLETLGKWKFFEEVFVNMMIGCGLSGLFFYKYFSLYGVDDK